MSRSTWGWWPCAAMMTEHHSELDTVTRQESWSTELVTVVLRDSGDDALTNHMTFSPSTSLDLEGQI